MISFFDFLLLFAVLFLPFQRFTDERTRKAVLFTYFITLSMFLIRRLTDSPVGILCIMITFFAALTIKKVYKLFSKSEYVIISADYKNNILSATDGKNIVTLEMEKNRNYSVGEIIRITAKSD